MSKILITGSHGFIGSHLREILSDKDCSYWDRKINKRVEDIHFDDLVDVETIIHLAANISVPESWDDPWNYIHNNTVNTLDLVEKAVKMGVKKFIFASSSSVYGNPISPYGFSKLASENILNFYKDKINVYPLRFFNVYGKGQNREYSGVITLFLEALKQQRELIVYGDGEQVRDFVFVKDLAKILKFFTETKQGSIPPIDIGKGYSNSVNELIKLLFIEKQATVPIVYEDPRREIKDSLADNSAMMELMPDFKFTELREGLEQL